MTAGDDRFHRRSVVKAGGMIALGSVAGCSGLTNAPNRDAAAGGATETVEVDVTATPTPGSESTPGSTDGADGDERSGNAAPDAEPATSADVTLVATDDGFAFDPPIVHVAVGGTVTWEVQGGIHTVTSYHPDNDLPSRIPEGATPWDSGSLGEAETFSYTFENAGVYDYVCVPHRMMGMVGTVVVGEPDPKDEPGLEPPQEELGEAERAGLADLEARARALLAGEGSVTESNGDGESAGTVKNGTECDDEPSDVAAAATEGNVTTDANDEINGTNVTSAEMAEHTPAPEEGATAAEQQGAAAAATHEVEIVSKTFRPDAIRIAQGDSVTWTLVDGTHTVTAYDGSDGHAPRIPDGATGWASGPLEAGESFSHTFETPGVYDYFCKPHHGNPMVGTVVVGSPDPAGQPGLASPDPALDDDTRAKIEELNRKARAMLEKGAGEESADGGETEPDADGNAEARQEPTGDAGSCGGDDVVDAQSETFEGAISIVFNPVDGPLAPGSEATVVARYHGKRLAHAPVEVDGDDEIVGATDACGEFRFTVPQTDSIRIEIRIDDARGRQDIVLDDG